MNFPRRTTTITLNVGPSESQLRHDDKFPFLQKQATFCSVWIQRQGHGDVVEASLIVQQKSDVEFRNVKSESKIFEIP